MPSGLLFTVMLGLLLGAQPMATDLYLPALPAIARELGSASSSLTLLMLAFGIGQLLCGWLADRLGRRPVLLSGLALYALSSVACALAPTVATLAGGRAVQGLAMAAILVCARAAVRDLHAARDGPRIMAKGLSGMGAVALLAPILGVQSWGWRWALVCMAVYAVAVLAICWRFFAETRPSRPATVQGRVRDVLSSRSFWAWSSLSTTTYGGFFCFLLLSPAIYIEYLGLSPLAYGWVPASSGLLYFSGTMLCRKLLISTLPLRAVQLASHLSLTGVLIQLGGALWAPHHLWPLLLGHWVFALGHGIHQPCGQAGAVGDFPHLAGRAVAWSGFMMMAVAFGLGQTVVRFMDRQHSMGAWPLVVPMVLCAGSLVLIAHVWLPRAGAAGRAR